MYGYTKVLINSNNIGYGEQWFDDITKLNKWIRILLANKVDFKITYHNFKPEDEPLFII